MLKKIIPLSFCFACLFTLLHSTAHAQSSSYEELQAAYIFNFAKYVQWPDEGSIFMIGIYGEPEIVEFLEKTLTGKKIRGRPIELKVISNIEEITEVSIVYVSASSSKDINAIVEATDGESILVVTEEDLIKKGAMISFVIEEDKLRFKLKKNMLTAAGLVASDGLLRLAIKL